MTQEDLIRNGFCCGQGCKECPYSPLHKYGSTVLRDDVVREEGLQFDKLCKSILNNLWKAIAIPASSYIIEV
jgi:hypothetical protein